MVPAQVIQVRRQAGEVRLSLVEIALDEMYVVGVGVRTGDKWDAAFDNAMGDRGSQQAGQIHLDARAQPPQGIGPGLGRGIL
jgi:hypothetical protein